MPDLPPTLVTELLTALLGLTAAVAMIVRGLPALADRWLKVQERRAQTDSTVRESAAQRELVEVEVRATTLDILQAAKEKAERERDEALEREANTQRLLAASHNENANLRAQIAGSNPYRRG